MPDLTEYSDEPDPDELDEPTPVSAEPVAPRPDLSRFLSTAPPTPKPFRPGKRREENKAGSNDGNDTGGEAGKAATVGARDVERFCSTETNPELRAHELLDFIGRQFVKLRKDGRSQAWASLEEDLMLNSKLLIACGMMSLKEWIQTAIEIEGFRKSEAGTQQLPGDYLAKWLAGAEIGTKGN